MLDLPLHRDGKQGEEVHDEDGPEHGDVGELEKSAGDGEDGRLGRRVPKLELGQPAHERTELLVVFRRQGRRVVLELGEGRVDLGREEQDEEVEVVDAQAVGDDVPTLEERSQVIFEAEGFGLPCTAWAGSGLLVKSRLIRIRADEGARERTRKFEIELVLAAMGRDIPIKRADRHAINYHVMHKQARWDNAGSGSYLIT
jgi:hypothetical protein